MSSHMANRAPDLRLCAFPGAPCHSYAPELRTRGPGPTWHDRSAGEVEVEGVPGQGPHDEDRVMLQLSARLYGEHRVRVRS